MSTGGTYNSNDGSVQFKCLIKSWQCDSEQYKDSETEAAQWSSATINWVIWTSAFHTLINHNASLFYPFYRCVDRREDRK